MGKFAIKKPGMSKVDLDTIIILHSLMVEIVKGETSNSYVEPGIVSKKSIPGNAGIHLIADKYEVQVQSSLNSLNINWFFYISSAVLAGILFLPQVREFFSEIGWRWAHILCLSFTLSFCLNPAFAWIAKRLNILDIPDERKLHI
jgi:hypothetical protein